MRTPALWLLAFSIPAIAGQRVEVAKGWFLNCGSQASDRCAEDSPYIGAIDHRVVSHGSASLSVSSESGRSPEFGGVMQVARAEEYRGKRIRYSAQVRSAEVVGWTGLWLRVDAADGEVLAFDNMQTSGRALSGSHDWERQSVVLDVPERAKAVFFGLVLSGSGKVWLDDVKIDVVPLDIPVTWEPKSLNMARNGPFPPAIPLHAPENLDFEE